MSDAPTVLILGGVGFVGRCLVKYLVDNKLASKIRVADKSMIAIACLHPEHKAAFDNEIVEFKQCDLSQDKHISKVFDDMKFDYVVNLCGETRCGLPDGDYKKKIVETAKKTSAASLKQEVKKFVEVSHAMVYSPNKNPSDEDSKIAPWTLQARYRLEAEEEVKKNTGLNLVILRPVSIYGKGDLTGLMPRLSVAAVYQYLKDKMQFLWGKDLRINSVHVDDVVRAIWTACTEISSGKVYNLCDESKLTQGILNEYLTKLFTVKCGFYGTIVSNLAKMNLDAVAEDANNKHVPGWAKLSQEHKVMNSPISPFMDKELLYNNHLSIDGSRIAKETKFVYTHPKVNVELLRDEVQFAIDQGIFPPVLKE